MDDGKSYLSGPRESEKARRKEGEVVRSGLQRRSDVPEDNHSLMKNLGGGGGGGGKSPHFSPALRSNDLKPAVPPPLSPSPTTPLPLTPHPHCNAHCACDVIPRFFVMRDGHVIICQRSDLLRKADHQQSFPWSSNV